VRDAFAGAVARIRGEPTRALHAPLHGVLGGEAQRRVRARALDGVVAPCAEALLGPA
jgi:hypothetical protein